MGEKPIKSPSLHLYEHEFSLFAAILRSTVRFSREKRNGAVRGETQDSRGKTKANQKAQRQQKSSKEVPGPRKDTT